MKKHSDSKSGLFLIELIISIFFFITASVVVLQLFVKSHFISERTISINNALLYTQNISEVFLANNGDFASVKLLYDSYLTDNTESDNNTLLMLFDKDWSHIYDTEKARYSILAKYTQDEDFAFVIIYVNEFNPEMLSFISDNDYQTAFSDTSLIYEQVIKKYCPKLH